MNILTITRIACLGAALLAGHAIADDYKTITVDQTETQLLTTALATESNYDSDESDRVCFTTITKLKKKTNSSNETKYKYYVQGCAVSKSTAQCTASCSPKAYKIKVIAKGTSLKVDDIDDDDDNDDDDSDSSDSDDRTRTPTGTTNSTASTTTTSPSSTTTTTTAPSSASTTAPVPTTTAPKASAASTAGAISSVVILAAAGVVAAQ